MSGNHRSAVIVARVLGVEGYSDFAHNQIELYWKHAVMDARREKNIARAERKFSKLVADLDLTERERKVLGHFISVRSQMSFDTGLRLGMMAFAHVNDKELK
jgi:hypothetical protein